MTTLRRPLLRQRSLIVAAVVALLVALTALLPLGPTTPDLLHRFAPPSWVHPLGTDQLGRDLFARILAGARLSVGFTLVALALCAVLGTTAGLTAGYVGGAPARALQSVVDVLVSIPTIVFDRRVDTVQPARLPARHQTGWGRLRRQCPRDGRGHLVDPVPPHPAQRRPAPAGPPACASPTPCSPWPGCPSWASAPNPHPRMGRHAGRGPQLPLPRAATRACSHDRHRHDHRGDHRPGPDAGTALDGRQHLLTTPITTRPAAHAADKLGARELAAGLHPAVAVANTSSGPSGTPGPGAPR
jgi:hypothetical protein